MPNSLKETIKQLRDLILSKVEENCGFSSNNIPEGKRAKHPSGEKKDSDRWESLLLECDTIKIFLKYDSVSKSDNFDDAQKIILHGNEFDAVRLAIYDDEEIANFSIKISGQDLFNTLGNRLPPDGRVYEIEKSSKKFKVKKNIKKQTLGHVLVLHIKETGKPWNIGPNLNSDQLENASKDLVNKVVATLKALLPVAKFYAENRKAILSGDKV